MLQNLKTDIIYHLTPSDFEMEFNLGGCCRMRLLTEKTTDKKGFVNALAKSVARSRVIMICGPLFSERGLLNIVSSAIGTNLRVINNAAYGISGDDKIKILEGSVPLVTKEGYFGGCVIERGPQAIILLTENKTIRKTLMKNLVHPYIEELSLIPQDQAISTIEDSTKYVTEVVEETIEEAPLAEENNEQSQEYIIAEPEAVEEEIKPLFEDTNEHNMPFIFDDMSNNDDAPNDDAVLELGEDDSIFVTEISENDIADMHGYDYNEEAEAFNMGLVTDVEEPMEKNLNVGILILTIVLLLALAALCFLVFALPKMQGVSVAQYIRSTFALSANLLRFR